MPSDGPWLAPSTWRNGKKTMQNKSRNHLLSGSRPIVLCSAAERITRNCSPCRLQLLLTNQGWLAYSLPAIALAVDKIASAVLRRALPVACWSVPPTCSASPLARSLRLVLKSPILSLDRAGSLLAFTFDLILVPHTCLHSLFESSRCVGAPELPVTFESSASSKKVAV